MGLLTNTRRRRWRSENVEQPDPREQANFRLTFLRLMVILAFVALTVQLARLQLLQGDEFEQRAALNQLRVEPVVPSRGLIYDRNGQLVVENVPSFSAVVVAADLPKNRSLEIAGAMQSLLGVPAADTVKRVEEARASNNPFTPVVVKEGLGQDEAFRVREELASMPGVQIMVQPVRHYVGGEILSAMLGYTGRVDEQDYEELKDRGYLNSDRIGKAGVEATYESYLRGVVGSKQIEKDASGREIRVLNETPAAPGNDLVLSIDLDLQKKATELVQASAKGGQAAAIVMDVHTGEVLAMVSLPMYDNNVLTGKIDENRLEQYLDDPKKPLVNHALAEQYAPGSIFKQITGSAALQEGVASPGTLITSNGYINVPNQYDPSIVYTFKDWRTLGTLDFYGGVAMSSDVYFYYLSGGYHSYGNNFNGLGIDRLARYTRAFGLGRPTGIDIAGEAPGNVPDAEWKQETFGEQWTLGDTYNMGIGQGFLAATPIQMVRVSAAVANGGTLLTPRVVREVRDSDGHVIVPNIPKVDSQIPISPENFAILRDAMTQAVSWGTAKEGGIRGVQVAGKTGTAEFGPRFADGSYETHAWFSGFAPAGAPEIAITVFLERGVGAIDAAPVASKILDYYFHRPLRAAAQPVGQQP
ncbi:MAG TPA: penicillin-binding protein 2 [Dehalococcoidia bacterium]